MPEETNLQQYVVVTREPDGGAKAAPEYHFAFQVDGSWSIYQGETPGTIDMTVRIAFTSERELTLGGYESSKRYFFRVVRNGAETAVVSEVQMPFEGQRNFRDLGGTVMADGRKIRWGMLYRSGDLSRFTSADKAYFQGLGIRTVIDFRSDEEVSGAPDKLPEGIEVIPLAIDDSLASRERILDLLKRGDAEALDTLLDQVYLDFVRLYHDQFSLFLQQLEEGDGPFVFHCTQGKDRTGWATTLLLGALGADKGTIFENYLATNRYLRNDIEKTIQMVNLAGLDGELLRPVLEADSTSLARALEEVEAHYGSLQNYLQQQMGVDVKRLQSLYLE